MQTVQIYTTASCPYCLRAKQLLKLRNVSHVEEIRIDTDPEAHKTMMARTGRRTVPQIFIGEAHVGGCDDLVALDQAGKLTPMLFEGMSADEVASAKTIEQCLIRSAPHYS